MTLRISWLRELAKLDAEAERIRNESPKESAELRVLVKRELREASAAAAQLLREGASGAAILALLLEVAE